MTTLRVTNASVAEPVFMAVELEAPRTTAEPVLARSISHLTSKSIISHEYGRLDEMVCYKYHVKISRKDFHFEYQVEFRTLLTNSLIFHRFSQTCFLDKDNSVTCDACPPGYEGRNCERCAAGFTGSPNSPRSFCQRDTSKFWQISARRYKKASCFSVSFTHQS